MKKIEMFSRTAATLGYAKFTRRVFPEAMRAVGPPRPGGKRGSYLKKVQHEISRMYKGLSDVEKKRACR